MVCLSNSRCCISDKSIFHFAVYFCHFVNKIQWDNGFGDIFESMRRVNSEWKEKERKKIEQKEENLLTYYDNLGFFSPPSASIWSGLKRRLQHYDKWNSSALSSLQWIDFHSLWMNINQSLMNYFLIIFPFKTLIHLLVNVTVCGLK